MNILLIGNGFDIAHGLPTTYRDFINFIYHVKQIKNFNGSKEEYIEKISSDKAYQIQDSVIQYIDEKIFMDQNQKLSIVEEDYHLKKIIELAENNFWIDWFTKLTTQNKWVDFEQQIGRVIKNTDNMIEYTKVHNKLPNLTSLQNNILQLFTNHEVAINSINYNILMGYKIKDMLLSKMNDLIECLNLYLFDCVKNIDIEVISPDINNLHVDKLLSFNYTDTFEYVYGDKNNIVQTDYIHGTSDLVKPNNMVLGIDEYLEGTDKYQKLGFIEFKKYYQRIYKKTGCKYKQWISKVVREQDTMYRQNIRLFIYGHSLALSDKDILKEIITNEFVYTTIYYHSDEQNKEQIINLVQILESPEQLTALVFGNNPRLKFVKQQDMIDKNKSDWQISRDIYVLANSAEYTTIDLEERVSRIKENIDNMNTDYFVSQSSLIIIFCSLLILNIDLTCIQEDKIFEIGKIIYINDPDHQNVSRTDYNQLANRISNKSSIQKFILIISKIEKFNKDHWYQKTLNRYNRMCTVLNMNLYCYSTQIQDLIILLNKFKCMNINTEIIWTMIKDLSILIGYNKVIETIKDLRQNNRCDSVHINELEQYAEKELKANACIDGIGKEEKEMLFNIY